MNDVPKNQKDWWAPVWRGLVLDPEAKHYMRMKNAIWLFLYLLLGAERRSGVLLRKIKTISLNTGIKERTIREWLGILRDQGYIETRNRGHCLSMVIKKWKTFSGRQESANQIGKTLSVRVAKSCRTEEGLAGQNSAQLRQITADGTDPNDITIKKDILKDDIDNNNFSQSNFDSFKMFRPRTKTEQLALELAEALNDQNGLALYLSYTKKYPESFLRRILGVVKKIPNEKIKKSRGALFNHLIQKYAKQTSQNHGD
jgi:DNA-binding transcriptional MocR family regulator